MEYKRIFDQGKKLEVYLDDPDIEHNVDFWGEFAIYRHMLDLFSETYDRVHSNRLASEIRSSFSRDGKVYTDDVFVTINPQDMNMDDDFKNEKLFIAKVHKFMHRKVMTGTYCFEQRGECDGDFHGLHVHALLHKYPNLNRDVRSQFGRFVGNSMSIKIMPCTSDDVVKRTRYMNGVKQGDNKALKCQNDVNMRLFFGLEPLYTC